MTHEMIIAGFGGQGVMLLGQLITYSGMLEDKNVSWLPSYGPEMRGGTANCMVIVSEDEVGSPLISEPTVLVAMSLPALLKFENVVRSGGLIIYNSSIIDHKPSRDDVTIVAAPCNDIAIELGSARIANMVALGCLVAQTGVVEPQSVLESLRKALPAHRHNLIPLNEQALSRGAQIT